MATLEEIQNRDSLSQVSISKKSDALAQKTRRRTKHEIFFRRVKHGGMVGLENSIPPCHQDRAAAL